MDPSFLPHNGLVLGGGRSALGLQHKAVVSAGHHLGLALQHAHQLQLRTRTLVVLTDCIFRDLHHVLLFHILDGLPPGQRRFGARGIRHQHKREEKKAVMSRHHNHNHCDGSLLKSVKEWVFYL